MSGKQLPRPTHGAGSLTVEQLQVGLRLIDGCNVDLQAFWDEHLMAFRETLRLAISETSETLFAPATPLHWRVELEAQLEGLTRDLEFAERYISRRPISDERQRPAGEASLSIH